MKEIFVKAFFDELRKVALEQPVPRTPLPAFKATQMPGQTEFGRGQLKKMLKQQTFAPTGVPISETPTPSPRAR